MGLREAATPHRAASLNLELAKKPVPCLAGFPGRVYSDAVLGHNSGFRAFGSSPSAWHIKPDDLER